MESQVENEAKKREGKKRCCLGSQPVSWGETGPSGSWDDILPTKPFSSFKKKCTPYSGKTLVTNNLNAESTRRISRNMATIE